MAIEARESPVKTTLIASAALSSRETLVAVQLPSQTWTQTERSTLNLRSAQHPVGEDLIRPLFARCSSDNGVRVYSGLVLVFRDPRVQGCKQ